MRRVVAAGCENLSGGRPCGCLGIVLLVFSVDNREFLWFVQQVEALRSCALEGRWWLVFLIPRCRHWRQRRDLENRLLFGTGGFG